MVPNHFKSLLSFATVFFTLTACMVGPDYRKPALDAPASFKETQGWKMAQPNDDAIRGAWWEIFNDPQLNALEEQVNISNQDLAAAEARFRQARALVQAARSSYFPTVTIGLAVARSRQSTNQSSSSSASQGDVTNSSLPIDVSWEADIWGRIRRTVEANRASAQASAADLETIRLSTQAEMALDYFQLRILDAQKRLLDATVSAYIKSLELTRNRYVSGVASSADVLQAETQLKTTQAQAIDVGVQRAQLEHAIAVLMGTPASTFRIPAEPVGILPPNIPAGLPSELLERRPDIAATERRVAAANAQIGVAKAAYFPKVTLSASGGFQSLSFSDWFAWPSRFWSVGPAISETVFDGGLRRSQSNQARASYDATVATYRQAALTAFQEVEDNLAAIRILEEEARVQEAAVKAARQSLAVVTNQYKVGTVGYLNVLTSQTTVLSNEKTAIDILGRRMAASVLLIKALGGGWKSSDLPTAEEVAGSLDQQLW